VRGNFYRKRPSLESNAYSELSLYVPSTFVIAQLTLSLQAASSFQQYTTIISAPNATLLSNIMPGLLLLHRQITANGFENNIKHAKVLQEENPEYLNI
jgi:hypothetical protein